MEADANGKVVLGWKLFLHNNLIFARHNNHEIIQLNNLIGEQHDNLTLVQQNILGTATERKDVASPSQKLAESLQALKGLQDKGAAAIRSDDLSRTHRERLLKNRFLREVMKGWYVPASQDDQAGDSTAWYASFWGFCAAYLNERFGDQWCLSAEQSLSLHAGNWTVPAQLLVRTPKGGNKPVSLPHGTALLDMRAALPDPGYRQELNDLRVFSLPAALVFAGAGAFSSSPAEARATVAMVRDASDVLAILLDGGHSTIAGRLAGAFRNIGRQKIADEILKSMDAAGYHVRESDPFEQPAPFAMPAREPSPYVTRVRLMWHAMRESVIEAFPAAPKAAIDAETYVKRVEKVYVTDAYHSLSIEGYRVSAELIERVRTGAWNPDDNKHDREHRNALAARGYFDAFQAVKDSVVKVLAGETLVRPQSAIMRSGTGNSSRRASPRASSSPPISPDTGTVRSISANRCMCRRTAKR